jgi:hypothetical protein
LHERSEFGVQRQIKPQQNEPDITPRMAEVLRALVRATQPLTGNQIGSACGLRGGYNERTKSVHTTHAGKVQGPAQRVIGALNALRKRGLIDFGSRPDGLSGTAYTLTSKGREFCRTWSL